MYKLIVAGNIGKDAELREVNGQNVISFSVAINQDYTNSEGVKVSKTTWINCAKWQDKNQRTGIVQYLKKGSKVIVDGTPEIKVWKDKQNQSHADMSVRVKEIHLMSSTLDKPLPNGNSTPGTPAPVAAAANEAVFEPADDLPF